MARTQRKLQELQSSPAMRAASEGRIRPSPAPGRAPHQAPGRRKLPFRLPSFTKLLVQAMVLLFAATASWRLALLGWEAYEASRFTRPPIVAQTPPVGGSLTTDAGLTTILGDARLAGGVVGAYTRNLTTGAGGVTNGDRRFPAASLFKLPIMVEVYKQQRLRRFSWDDELTLTRDQWADGSGVLQARVGHRFKIGDLLRLMIDESDNIAANMLVDLVGAANINQTMDALSLRNTRVTDRTRENSPPITTPEDMGRLLEIIGTGGLVDAQTSEEAIRLLEREQVHSWLADGLPWWTKLAHKWGDLPNARHDAGIIYTPRSQIVLVVLTENGSPAAAAEQIRSLSRKVFRYFEGSGP